jgi:dihydrofolate reductase
MSRLIYSMSISLDGYIFGPDGSFDWSVPDEEQHRFHNEQARELDLHLLGRRLYETMLYWEKPQDPEWRDFQLEFARVWKELPKLVFSSTLEEVVGNTRLVDRSIVAEVEELKRTPGQEVGIGGALLAAPLIERDLIDEYRVFIHPVVVGGGRPFFPALERPIELELIETRTFRSRVVYARYGRRR